jgi:hypothetical protein
LCRGAYPQIVVCVCVGVTFRFCDSVRGPSRARCPEHVPELSSWLKTSTDFSFIGNVALNTTEKIAECNSRRTARSRTLSPSSLTLDHEAACTLGLRWLAHGRSLDGSRRSPQSGITGPETRLHFRLQSKQLCSNLRRFGRRPWCPRCGCAGHGRWHTSASSSSAQQECIHHHPSIHSRSATTLLRRSWRARLRGVSPSRSWAVRRLRGSRARTTAVCP